MSTDLTLSASAIGGAKRAKRTQAAVIYIDLVSSDEEPPTKKAKSVPAEQLVDAFKAIDDAAKALDDAHAARARKRRAKDERLARELEIAKWALIRERDAAILAFTTGTDTGALAQETVAPVAVAPVATVAPVEAHTGGPATPATALLRILSCTSPGSAKNALNFIRLAGPDFETLPIEGFAAQCGAPCGAPCGQGLDGRVASAVVASRQFGSGGIGFDLKTVVVPDPRFTEALLDALRDITGVDFASSTAMDHAMSEHERRTRVFAAEAFPRFAKSKIMELFATVTHVHESAAGCCGGIGGLIESKEDLAAACNTGWVDRALDHMFCEGDITAMSADSVVSAIQAYLGGSGTCSHTSRD